MSVWDDELASCDQYAITKLTNKIVDIQACNDKFIKVMQADDVLEIGAEYIRGSNGTRLQVAPDFVTKIESRSKSRQELIGAKHIKTGRYISKPEYESMSDKSGTAPIYRKVCKGVADRYIRIGYSPNELTIKLSKLAHFTKSRHRALIDSIVEDEIFTYTPRQCEQTYKHRYNQARLMLKRRFYIKGYEWGLTFNPAISATLYPLLCRIAVPYKGTFYL
ncbi:MAG: hypothetical protein ACXWTU_05855, partial [Methylotenera sp.]